MFFWFCFLGGGGMLSAIDRIRAPVQIITRDEAVLRTREEIPFAYSLGLRGKRMVGDVLSGMVFSPAYLYDRHSESRFTKSKSVNNTTTATTTATTTVLSLLLSSVHSCASPESGTRVNPTPAQRHLSMGSSRQCSEVTQRQDHELTSCLVSKPHRGTVASPKPRSPGHLGATPRARACECSPSCSLAT